MYIEAWIDAKNMKKGGYMTDKQPEALRLADLIEQGRGNDVIYAKEAAAELHRLHEMNVMLVEALNEAEWNSLDLPHFVVDRIRAALAKAEGK